MLEANDMVEAKLAEIRERKIYEMKRMFAAKMDEAYGGLTNAEIEARKKAGYKKASEVLGDPRKEQLSDATKKYREERKKAEKKKEEKKSWFPKIDMKKEKKISEETLDEDAMAGAADIMKTLRSKGIRGSIARSALRKLRGRKTNYSPLKQAEKFGKDAESKVTPPEDKDQEPKYKRPGMIKRNINTLMGREPGYVDNRTPEEKLQSKGGRVGKVGRFVAKDVIGRGAKSLASDLSDIGTSNLK